MPKIYAEFFWSEFSTSSNHPYQDAANFILPWQDYRAKNSFRIKGPFMQRLIALLAAFSMGRLKRLVADLTLDNAILKEVTRGNF